MRAAVYLPDGRGGPGRHSGVDLDVPEPRSAELVLPEATVRDEHDGGDLFDDGCLVFDRARGRGPLAGPAPDRQARRFGLVNAACHTQRHLAPLVLGVMAKHGIHLGISNSDPNRAARAGQDRRVDA